MKVRKGEVASWIFEMAVDRIQTLCSLYKVGKRAPICPTRLTMDGYRVWQQPNSLEIRLIDPDDSQILDFMDNDAYLINDAVFGTTIYGSVFVACARIVYEDEPLISCLEQTQWIPVEADHDA